MSRLAKILPNWLYQQLIRLKPYGYQGDYKNWAAASAKAGQYNQGSILAKLEKSAQELASGKAAYERDGVLFHEKKPAVSILNALLMVVENKQLSVLDFGGGLGGYYFQHKSFLPADTQIDWQVAELEATQAIGRKWLQNEELHFDPYTTDTKAQAKFLLLGCVLPYLEDPYAWLVKFYEAGFEWVLVDKHPLIKGKKDRLTIQRVSPKIYAASYPAWFFGEEKWKLWWEERYTLVYDYACSDQSNLPGSTFRGYLFKRKKQA